MADLRARLAQATGFQWDAGNATKNWAKHEVSQTECEQVFLNAPLVLAADPDHSTQAEARFFALGQTDGARLLLIVFTLRGPLVRVISARPMSRGEREVYRDAQAQKDAE